MGMSTHAIGLKPATAEHKKKCKELEKLQDAGDDSYDNKQFEELMEYFEDDDRPEPTVVKVDIPKATKEWSDGECWGVEIDISKLPKGVTKVRVYNSM